MKTKIKPKGHKTSAMSKHQKILIGIAVAFLLYSIIGFLLVPTVLKNTLEKKLSENLKRPVTIETIQINPYLLKVTVNNFSVKNRARDDHFIGFEQLFIDLEAISVFKRALVIKTLTLTGPRVNLARFNDLSYNFSDLAESSSSPKKKTESKPFLFSLNNIEILNGSIVFLDEPKKSTHRVENLNLAIPYLSNVVHEVEVHVEPAFSAIINDTPVNLTGRTIPFHDTRSTVFDIRVNKLNIPEYLAYIPNLGDLTLKSGYLDIMAVLGFEMQEGKKPTVTLTGDFSLTEIDITETQGESYLAIPQLDFTIADSSPLEKNFHLSSVSLNEPEFLLRRSSDGDILPLGLLQKDTETKSSEPESSDKETSLKLVVDEIALNGGTVRFEDLANAEQFQTTLNPVEIKVTGLSTLEGEEASYDISLRTDAEEKIAMNGTLSLNPLKTQMHGSLQGLQIPRFSPYYAEIVTPQIMDGSLDLAADLQYSTADEVEIMRADNISTQLHSIIINDKDNKKLLTIPSLSIRETSLDLNGHQLIIGDFSSSDGELHLVRQKDGLVILKELLKPREVREKEPDNAEADTSAPWTVTLQKGAVSQFSIVLQDNTPAEPITLLFDKLRLIAENISTIKNNKGKVELGFRLDKKAAVSIKGPVTIEPLSTSLKLDVADLQVKTLQPYFNDKVNLVVGDGAVSLDAQLSISQDSKKKISTLFRGKAGITDFSSFDPVAGEEFLKWKDLRLEGMEYDSDSSAFIIKEVGWQDFYNKIVVFDDGSVNLKAIMKDSGEPDAEVQEKTAPVEITKKDNALLVKVDTLTLDNGQFDFLDQNITPNYATSLSGISGTITGLSSEADILAEVNISGKLDQHAPLLITGKINPLREELFADLTIDFSDIELSPTTPYTGKFIGYTVAKGKLSLDLEYLVEGSKITGKNEAFLDQFTLGNTVESPDAMNLPINLAISLLRNREGEITLNVPVKGDLKDPEFSIGGVVFKVIINLIAKAATSPFALLGALIPEGEDLQYVDFAPGSSLIDGEFTKSLETIAKVLYDRPGLKMDIKGSFSADQERKVLHEKQFGQLLKNEKYKKLTKKKDETIPFDEIVIEPEEFEEFLKKAYKAATFKKPKNALGFTKRLPPAEMEKLLRDNIIITDDDLRLLAIERANAVKSFLVDTGTVEPERLFILEPKTGADEPGSLRVDMTIK
ncbi:DUF748 domain-containing protein [Thermodesulfobacteriota bacterium]